MNLQELITNLRQTIEKGIFHELKPPRTANMERDKPRDGNTQTDKTHRPGKNQNHHIHRETRVHRPSSFIKGQNITVKFFASGRRPSYQQVTSVQCCKDCIHEFKPAL
eukprot:6484845-Amphidinium_carterae.1